MITGLLSMKPWIRRTAPVSPLLFVHTRQRNTEKVDIYLGEEGGGGSILKMKIRSVSFFHISCKKLQQGRDFSPLGEENDRVDSRK